MAGFCDCAQPHCDDRQGWLRSTQLEQMPAGPQRSELPVCNQQEGGRDEGREGKGTSEQDEGPE